MLLLPRLDKNLATVEVTVVLEVTLLLVTEKTEVANYLSHPIRVCLVVSGLVIQLIVQLLHLRSLLYVIEKMIKRAIATNTGTVKVTRLGHNLSSHCYLDGRLLIVIEESIFTINSFKLIQK